MERKISLNQFVNSLNESEAVRKSLIVNLIAETGGGFNPYRSCQYALKEFLNSNLDDLFFNNHSKSLREKIKNKESELKNVDLIPEEDQRKKEQKKIKTNLTHLNSHLKCFQLLSAYNFPAKLNATNFNTTEIVSIQHNYGGFAFSLSPILIFTYESEGISYIGAMVLHLKKENTWTFEQGQLSLDIVRSYLKSKELELNVSFEKNALICVKAAEFRVDTYQSGTPQQTRQNILNFREHIQLMKSLWDSGFTDPELILRIAEKREKKKK